MLQKLSPLIAILSLIISATALVFTGLTYRHNSRTQRAFVDVDADTAAQPSVNTHDGVRSVIKGTLKVSGAGQAHIIEATKKCVDKEERLAPVESNPRSWRMTLITANGEAEVESIVFQNIDKTPGEVLSLGECPVTHQISRVQLSSESLSSMGGPRGPAILNLPFITIMAGMVAYQDEMENLHHKQYCFRARYEADKDVPTVSFCDSGNAAD